MSIFNRFKKKDEPSEDKNTEEFESLEGELPDSDFEIDGEEDVLLEAEHVDDEVEYEVNGEMDEEDFEDTEIVPYSGAHAKKSGGAHVASNAGGIDQLDDAAAATMALSTLVPNSTAEMVAKKAELSAEEKAAKRKHRRKVLLITFGSIFGAILLAYLGLAFFFMSHFGINSKINGVDVSWKSVASVESMLTEKAGDYSLTITERNDVTETISGADIEFAYESNGEVQALLDAQNEFFWPTRLVKFLLHKDFGDYRVTYAYNEDAFNKKVAALDCNTPSKFVAPENAYPQFNGTEYEIVAENPGTTVDTEKLVPMLVDKVSHGEATLDLDGENLYIAPEITSDNEELAKQVETYNKYVPFALTYDMGDGKTYVLDGKEIFEWLTIGDDDSVTVDKAKVKAWVKDFAKKYDTLGEKRKFKSVGNGNTYTVEGGTYGWKIDQSKEVDSILTMIDTKESQSRKPYYTSEAKTHGKTDWGDDWIEVNISTQHVYVIKGGKVALSAPVVTGAPTPKRATPTGVYTILEIQRNKTLRGEVTGKTEDGKPIYEYESPVAYWARVTWTGVGFHDATWQSSFGGNRYRNGFGSHGCINMSMSDARALYGLVYVGMPVVIHY